MAKKIKGYLKIQVPAGAANPAPPIGPALGQRGLNIMEFCKSFNSKTQSLEKNSPVPVIVTIFQDNSFTFETKTAPVSYLIRKAAGASKGSALPGRTVGGRISAEDVREIAKVKMPDLNADSEEAAARIVEGSARSMGFEVS